MDKLVLFSRIFFLFSTVHFCSIKAMDKDMYVYTKKIYELETTYILAINRSLLLYATETRFLDPAIKPEYSLIKKRIALDGTETVLSLEDNPFLQHFPFEVYKYFENKYNKRLKNLISY